MSHRGVGDINGSGDRPQEGAPLYCTNYDGGATSYNGGNGVPQHQGNAQPYTVDLSRISVGIDLGGSHITAVVVNTANGDILVKCTTAVCQEERADVSCIVDKISECVTTALTEKFIEPMMSSTSGEALSIGIGVPGNVDPINGTTRYLPNFGWLNEVPLRKLLHDSLGAKLKNVKFRPLNMRNDGRCAALAEAKYGAGKFSPAFSMLTLGTGIGGALVLNGNVFDGCSFDAGDFGHHVIRGDDGAFDCACGKKGCFETHASAQGLVRHFKRLAGTMNSTDCHNAEDVLDKMRNGDKIAQTAFDRYLDDLTTGLANLVTFYNPDTIALGGGLSQSVEIFERAQALVDQKTLPATKGKVMLVPSLLGPQAGAIGAALVGMQPY